MDKCNQKHLIWYFLFIRSRLGGVKPIAGALQKGFLLLAPMIISMLLGESENAFEVSKVCKPRTDECYQDYLSPTLVEF
jgi:hypothetical protein